jgi:L-aminopeptidase/D-esterase-like protein
MKTITKLMTERSRLDAELLAMPLPVGSTDDEWEHVFDRKCDVEDAILAAVATTIDGLRHQVAILAQRAVNGFDVGAELARLGVQRDA